MIDFRDPLRIQGYRRKNEYVSSSVAFSIQGLWFDPPGSPHSTDRSVFVGAALAPHRRAKQINLAGADLQAMLGIACPLRLSTGALESGAPTAVLRVFGCLKANL